MGYIPIIARVNALPPLPESVLELEKLYATNDPDIDAIVKIIESDPSLTADLLAKANAPLYSFSRQIISVMQAVTLFGSSKIRAMVLAATLNRSFDIDMSPYGIKTTTFSKISMLQSELMFQWYMGIDVDKAKLLTPIAFLMETGKVLIAKDIIEQNRIEQFVAEILTYEKAEDVENIYVSMTTAQINALIFDHWNLNTLFIECMRYLDEDSEAPKHIESMVQALRIVRAAVNIKAQLSEESMAAALKRANNSPYDAKRFEKVMLRIREKLAQ